MCVCVCRHHRLIYGCFNKELVRCAERERGKKDRGGREGDRDRDRQRHTERQRQRDREGERGVW